MMGYDEQFPPLAPGKADKKVKETGLLVSVNLAITGERIAEFPSNSRCRVATVCAKLQDVRPVPLGLHYDLAFGEKKLQPDSFLGDLGAQTAIELQAHVPPTGSIVLPGVTGAAELPDSGDIIVASKGDITEGQVRLETIGPDDGLSSYMWLWRLSKSHGYALQHATLLTRWQGYSTAELRQQWSVCVRMQQAGEPESAFKYQAFSLDTVKKFGESPKALPHSPNLCMYTWVYAHSEKYALLTWGKTGCEEFWIQRANIERLDIETGKVDHVAEISDLWGITTNPRDGTIFCATRYAGAAISQLSGTTVTNLSAAPREEDNLVIARMGQYGVAFDPELFGGALICPYFVFEDPTSDDDESPTQVDAGMAVALPPGTDVAEALKLGGEYHDLDQDIGWMSIPGDKTKPWHVIRFPGTLPLQSRDQKPDERAMMSFSSKAGKVACLDFSKTGKVANVDVGSVSVFTASLGDDSSTQNFVAPQVPPTATLITALNFADEGGSKRFVFSPE
eukprot:TRINITY_DN3953_c0_g1_i1.p1 TRINITY_DN3953_c0_g1~~TRINITY_DN3953_c0_g1_i1.p1  ORF type:complete len:507 (-),score=73.49 TRINITY_DN3953_c0_g1_i1:13-1533(-)